MLCALSLPWSMVLKIQHKDVICVLSLPWSMVQKIQHKDAMCPQPSLVHGTKNSA